VRLLYVAECCPECCDDDAILAIPTAWCFEWVERWRRSCPHDSRRAGYKIIDAKPGDELNSILAACQGDLKRQWSEACKHLKSLPTHQKTTKKYESADSPPIAQVSLSILQQQSQSAGSADVVVQVALRSAGANFSRAQVILLAAYHTLADLRDAIYCANDRYAEDSQGRRVAGGLFYIHNTLYTDTRDANAVDYSEPIRQFLSENAMRANEKVMRCLSDSGGADRCGASAVPPVKQMQNATLGSLVLRPAEQGDYVYLHAGACEHIVVIEDVRLRHSTDPSLDLGPVVLRKDERPLEICCVCGMRPAVRIAYEDPLAPCSPAFMCAGCFESLHFDCEGVLLPEARNIDVFPVYL
jgi:hypothetical protein